MSAYIVSDDHIAYLTWAGVEYRLIQESEVEQTALMLLHENHKSVAFRYGEKLTPIEDLSISIKRFVEFSWGQVIAAAHCYEYQACEHDGWKQSAAYDYYLRLVMSAIRKAPEVDSAHWSIDAMVIESAGRLIKPGMPKIYRVIGGAQ